VIRQWGNLIKTGEIQTGTTDLKQLLYSEQIIGIADDRQRAEYGGGMKMAFPKKERHLFYR
jgi:hypothetical protein